MAQKKKSPKFIIVILLFIVYFFAAAKPIPRETVLSLNWIKLLPTVGSPFGYVPSEETSSQRHTAVSGRLFPFTLGSSFGYIDSAGEYALHRVRTSDIYLSQNMWTEYGAEPSRLVVNNITRDTAITIENVTGYPVLLDNRVFILGSEQNILSEVSESGNVLWTYEFGAPITAIDAAAGLVVTGSLDGLIEVFDSAGERIFNFPPSGSRYSVVLGCAMSRNGSRIAIIFGIDRQRFLLLERLGNTGGEYKIIYHEFLDTGFRRPVRVLFVNDDQRIVFEREGGIGSYNIRSRRSIFIPLDGEIAAIDESGDNGFLFLVTSHNTMNETYKRLVGIKFPKDGFFGLSRNAVRDAVFLKAPFNSENVFLGRIKNEIVIGGGDALISFDLEEK
ncbi:MAG: PQQ-like beta-propeller repeat protein [Treponema sp.]|nr:PQQ-like beta-propeller repeat protein [Treponema sp.]